VKTNRVDGVLGDEHFYIFLVFIGFVLIFCFDNLSDICSRCFLSILFCFCALGIGLILFFHWFDFILNKVVLGVRILFSIVPKNQTKYFVYIAHYFGDIKWLKQKQTRTSCLQGNAKKE